MGKHPNRSIGRGNREFKTDKEEEEMTNEILDLREERRKIKNRK